MDSGMRRIHLYRWGSQIWQAPEEGHRVEWPQPDILLIAEFWLEISIVWLSIYMINSVELSALSRKQIVLDNIYLSYKINAFFVLGLQNYWNREDIYKYICICVWLFVYTCMYVTPLPVIWLLFSLCLYVTHGIMVSIVGSQLAYRSSKPEWGHFHFTLHEYPRKWYESNYSLTSYEWIVWQTGLFNCGMATSLVEWKLWIQTSCRPGEGWALPGYSYPTKSGYQINERDNTVKVACSATFY